jgi:hypothetical protein
MNTEITILALLLLLVLIAGIVYCIARIKFAKVKYKNQLMSIHSDIVSCDDDFKKDFISEINNYETTNDTLNEIEEKIRKLPFPIPPEPNDSETGENIIGKLTTLIDKYSLAFAGTEQFILSVFPSEQIGHFTIYALNTIATHSSQAITENLVSLKASFTEGIDNFHNMDKIVEGLKNIGAYYFHSESGSVHLRLLIDKFYESKLNAASSFFGRTAVDIANPIFNIDVYGSEIGLSWIEHGRKALAEIENFNFDLDIDHSGSFPFVTLIISSTREINLHRNSKTSIESSIKNLTLDVAGTGLGACGGAKAGMLIGSFFGPLGSAIGGVVGGIGGAIGGRVITNDIKRQELNNAVESYSLEFNNMLTDTKKYAITSVENVRLVAINKQNELKNNLPTAPRFNNSNLEVITITQKLAESLKEDVENYDQQLSELKKSKFASKQEYKAIINDINSKIKKIKELIPSENDTNNEPIQSLRNLINIPFFGNKEFHNELIMSYKDLKELIENHRVITLAWTKNANALYKQAIHGICSELNTQAKNYNKKCSEWKEALERKRELVQKERDKLGIK